MMDDNGNYTGMMNGDYWIWDILGWIFVIGFRYKRNLKFP
jgi:hypothetical protein